MISPIEQGCSIRKEIGVTDDTATLLEYRQHYAARCESWKTHQGHGTYMDVRY